MPKPRDLGDGLIYLRRPPRPLKVPVIRISDSTIASCLVLSACSSFSNNNIQELTSYNDCRSNKSCSLHVLEIATLIWDGSRILPPSQTPNSLIDTTVDNGSHQIHAFHIDAVLLPPIRLPNLKPTMSRSSLPIVFAVEQTTASISKYI